MTAAMAQRNPHKCQTIGIVHQGVLMAAELATEAPLVSP